MANISNTTSNTIVWDDTNTSTLTISPGTTTITGNLITTGTYSPGTYSSGTYQSSNGGWSIHSTLSYPTFVKYFMNDDVVAEISDMSSPLPKIGDEIELNDKLYLVVELRHTPQSDDQKVRIEIEAMF